MTPEIRRAAVRAAAKAALVLSVGCGSAAPAPTTPAPPPAGSAAAAPTAAADTPATCSAYLDGLATAKFKDLPPDDPLRALKGRFIESAFTDVALRKSARTQACCTQELTDRLTSGTNAHRWTCCSALATDEVGDNISNAACSPWGPPCPPAMVG